MSKLDKDLEEDLKEAYGANGGVRFNGPHGYWKYCMTCVKMQAHKEEKIAGIVDWVCQVCGAAPRPTIKPVFRLTQRPK